MNLLEEEEEEPAEDFEPQSTKQVERTYWFMEMISDGYGSREGRLAQKEDGNLISSLCSDGQHMPVIDIDYSADLVPSTTPGHYHLFLNKAIPWDKYLKVLEALADADLIEPGYYKAAKLQTMSYVTAHTHARYEELKRRIVTSGTLFPSE